MNCECVAYPFPHRPLSGRCDARALWESAYEDGFDIANMSLGAPISSDAMQRAVRYAKGTGVIIVAAAGNSGGSVGFPGSYPEVIAVSASSVLSERRSAGSARPRL